MTSRHDPTDDVDAIVDAWRRELPDLDVEPLHVFSRVSRLARLLDLDRKRAVLDALLEVTILRVGGGRRAAPKDGSRDDIEIRWKGSE